MKRLADNLTSRYLQLANKLRPKQARKKIVAYVESYDDVLFWRSILEEFETEEYRFEVMLPSRNSLSKGKKTALMNRLGESLGSYMIACVDADYDWLMQDKTDFSRRMNSNPFVFHTYAYAIENLQCYAPSLHKACVMSTLNDRVIVDTEVFMEEYSRIIWPLFVWNVWSYRNLRFKEFSMSDMSDIIGLHDVSPQHPELALEELRKRVNKAIPKLQAMFPEGKGSFQALRDELLELGLTPESTYLYIQGHSLLENVVLPLLVPICTILRREREKEIMQLAQHSMQKQNELAGYQHCQCPIEVMLRKMNDFKQSVPYQFLKADITRFMADVGRAK